MTDIFLSYSREDQATARRFAEAFECEGLTVWWDQTLKPGEAYDRVTEKALQDAKAVVVLWSRKSVESHWVRSEATQAQSNRTLVPVMIEPCKRPIMFELMHTAELGQWRGDPNDSAWQTFLGDVRQFIGQSPVQPAAIAPRRAVRVRSHGMQIFVICAVIALLFAAPFWVLHRRAAVSTVAVSAAPGVAAVAPAARKEVTLAVLPFADYSTAHDQESFCDGLSEEILNQLAQVKGLTVTARTSSFSFKGKNEDVRVIAKALGVANLLEGSVQKEGNQLRITAQLIDGNSGTHMWSKIYPRELKDIFVVQDEIARDVAQALQITLGVGELALQPGMTRNAEAYQVYLQGVGAANRNTPPSLLAAQELFRKAIALDPNFIPAMMGLGGSLGQYAIFTGTPLPDEATSILVTVRRLAPDHPMFDLYDAQIALERFDWPTMKKALDHYPGPSNALSDDLRAVFLLFTGHCRDAIEFLTRVKSRDPLNPNDALNLALAFACNDQLPAAIAEAQRAVSLGAPDLATGSLFFLSLAAKDQRGASRLLATIVKTDFTDLKVNEKVAPFLDRPDAARRLLRELAPKAQSVVELMSLAYWSGYFGDFPQVLDLIHRLDTHVVGRGRTIPTLLWSPLTRGISSLPEYKPLLREVNLVDYWRASGSWADSCKPLGKDDFECH